MLIPLEWLVWLREHIDIADTLEKQQVGKSPCLVFLPDKGYTKYQKTESDTLFAM